MMDDEALEKAEQQLSFGLLSSHLRYCAQGREGSDEDSAEAALDIVLRLAFDHGPAMGKVGVCSAVVECVEKFMEEAAVVEVGLGCIDRLSRKATRMSWVHWLRSCW